MMAARQVTTSFGGQFPDVLTGLVRPRKGVNANRCKVLREDTRLFAVAERADQQPGLARFLGDIAVDALEQVVIAPLDTVELAGKLRRIGSAGELDPKAACSRQRRLGGLRSEHGRKRCR